MNLADHPLIVLVVHQEGCGACDAYLPTARACAERWAGCCPTVFIDARANGPLLDRLGVQHTPTTLAVRESRIVDRIEGAADMDRVEEAFLACARGCRP
jgi:thioredoxin-like negative regulator of GroEL